MSFKLLPGYRVKDFEGRMWIVMSEDMVVDTSGNSRDGVFLASTDGYNPVMWGDDSACVAEVYDKPAYGSWALDLNQTGPLLWSYKQDRKKAKIDAIL